MKSIFYSVLCFFFLVVSFYDQGMDYSYMNNILNTTFNNKNFFRKRFILKSSMAIFTEEDRTLPCFIFPKGASLYYDTGFSEGFSRYVMYVNISDSYTNDADILEFNQEDIISPIWLTKIDKDTLEYIINNFHLSKEDVTKIIKQNGITKDDLLDIIRSI